MEDYKIFKFKSTSLISKSSYPFVGANGISDRAIIELKPFKADTDIFLPSQAEIENSKYWAQILEVENSLTKIILQLLELDKIKFLPLTLNTIRVEKLISLHFIYFNRTNNIINFSLQVIFESIPYTIFKEHDNQEYDAFEGNILTNGYTSSKQKMVRIKTKDCSEKEIQNAL